MPSTPPPDRPRSNRAVKACRNCRERKVRCTGERPCKDCQRLNKDCIYLPSQRRRRKGDKSRRPRRQNPTERAARRRSSPVFGVNGIDPEPTPASQQLSPDLALSPVPPLIDASLQRHDFLEGGCPPIADAHQSLACSEQSPSVDEQDIVDDFDQGFLDSQTCGYPYEYAEPWSWTSMCSEAGSRWVWSVTGDQNFISIARKFSMDSENDKVLDENILSTAKAPELTEETAWLYTDAFYTNCWEADLGFLDRSVFERHLRLQTRDQKLASNHAWIALKYTVFASGYRSLLAKQPDTPFSTAQSKAGHLFKKALSLFTRILMPPTTMLSIQALTLMALYVEGLASPQFKHFLCSNAVHLAQVKGLHRQTERYKNVSDSQSLSCSWLWWSLYAFEKHLAFSSNRPSAIDDSTITVPSPNAAPEASNTPAQIHGIAVRHARVQSQISAMLASKTSSMSVEDVITNVAHFQTQLKQLIDEVPPEYKIGVLARPPHSSPRLVHMLYLHLSIYGSLLALHAQWSYPWVCSEFLVEEDNASLKAQITYSSATVADAARKMLLALRLVNTDVTTPSWLAWGYPIIAAMNLFIYILKYPMLSTVTEDLGLLDVATGHFGYIDYLTSSRVSTSLPRKAANVAYKVVKSSKPSKVPHELTSSTPLFGDQSSFSPLNVMDMADFEFGGTDLGLPLGDGSVPFAIPQF